MVDRIAADLDQTTRALLERAMQQLRAQQLDLATATLQQVLDHAPDQPTALQLLGVAAFKSGRGDEAVRLLQRATTVAPDYLDAHYNLANVFLFQDRLREAEAGFRRVLALNARHFDAQLNLSGTLTRMGRLAEAVAACRAALEIDPRNAVACNNLGQLYREQGQYEAAVHAIERAVQADPGNPQYRINLRDTYRRAIPAWHFAMLNDQARNDAFERAITKAARGRRLVLDIGTGSGLLAMIAARAGAERVVACEANTPLAQVAARIIARNGYADRITVVARRSTQLAVGQDLPEPADLLISEILDAGLLGEGVIRTFRHACATLITPGAAIIPAGATVYGIVIECPELRRVNPIREISGFDLSEFDIFRNPVAHGQITLAHEPHRVLSAPFEIARFDFRQLANEQVARPVSIEVTADGTAQAVAFWFDLRLDDVTTLSTAPGGASKHWRQALTFFDRDRTLRRGEALQLAIGHTDSNFVFRWP
jgi:predicted RNA methylase/Flp pilus assembly protein TadD